MAGDRLKKSGINLDPAKKGTLTAEATKHGLTAQAFARKVQANPDNYSPKMRKKANFAVAAASKWKH